MHWELGLFVVPRAHAMQTQVPGSVFGAVDLKLHRLVTGLAGVGGGASIPPGTTPLVTFEF